MTADSRRKHSTRAHSITSSVTPLRQPSPAARLMALYPSNANGHAYWTPGLEKPRPTDGKMQVRVRLPSSGRIREGYMDVHEPVTAAHWKQHLDGERALVPGIACEDGTSKSCTVDVDVYGLDLSVLTVRAADRAPGIPLYVCRSKSKGGHVTAFASEPLPIGVQNMIARGIAEKLGLFDLVKIAVKKGMASANLELFPDPKPPKPGKQPRGLNMPYLGGRDYPSGFVRPDKSTEEIPLAEFLDTVQFLSQDHVDELIAIGRTVKITRDRVGSAPRPSGGAETDEERGQRYAATMLDKYAAELEPLRQGERNEPLRDKAYHLGTMICSGWIDRETVEKRLRGALREWDGKALDDMRRHLDDGRKVQHSPLPKKDGHADVIAEMNTKYAFVRVGSDSMVIAEQPEFTLLKVRAFYDETCNRTVVIETAKGPKEVPIGRFWMHHPDRRTYQGITFDPSRLEVPGRYNLWKGFSVQPKAGDCSKFLAHVRDNVAGGNQEHFDWIMGWFADIVQNPAPRSPAKRSGTALVLRGPQGVGKTKVGEVTKMLLGPYHVAVYDARGVTGHFNRHLKNCLLLQCDEAFWAGSKDAAGILKSLITAETIQIEGKGVDRIEVKNLIRLLILGNEEWIVPAEPGERRHAVFDVLDTKKEDAAYFRAIDEEMENGGREALMHYLLSFDLSKVNVRKIPETQALLSQKIETMRSHEAWWYETLQEGELPWGCDGERTCPVRHLYENYRLWAQGRRSSPTAIGMFLAKMGARKTKLTYSTVDNGQLVHVTAAVYIFETLTECRERFEKFLKQTVHWQNPATDWIVRKREVVYRGGI